MRELKKQYSDINSRMPRHSCCEVRVMQLHDILLLRTSAILPEAISAGGFEPAGSRLKWLYFFKFPWCADFRADFYNFGSTTSKSVRASRRTDSSS